MVIPAPGPAAVGIVVDHLVGEPPLRPHPLGLFGDAMEAVEDRLWSDHRGAGVVHAVVGVVVGAAAGVVVRSAAAATYLAVAGRSLDDAAADVEAALLAGDLDQARTLLPALVGRDPAGLDADEVARAVIESLAENSVDAVVAPALWGAVAGAPGALAYRAVNTLDAMVGHRSARHQRYGWASARLDDAANWVPARVAGVLVIALRPSAAATALRVVRHDAPAHPSPNGGVIEGAFAAALGVRLGGPSTYGDRHEDRPTLGDGRPPGPGDIAAARTLARQLHLATAAGLGAWAALRRIRRVRRNGRPGTS
jgi:adenosylcobinamide-phosphate synthase